MMHLLQQLQRWQQQPCTAVVSDRKGCNELFGGSSGSGSCASMLAATVPGCLPCVLVTAHDDHPATHGFRAHGVNSTYASHQEGYASLLLHPGEDIAQHLAEASRAAPAAAARGRGGSHSSSAAGGFADRAANQQLEYGLELLGLAVGRGQTAALMTKGPAAGECRHVASCCAA